MKPLSTCPGRPQRRARARGMATLTVVMVMFFVMAMVAAYTNRNLIFEQRTSANSYRSAQSLTAAEAGIDWAAALLNGGTIDQSCTGGGAGATDDFRSRYLNLEHDGSFTITTWPSALGNVTPTPACVMTPAGWNCSCPNGPLATPAPPAPTDEAPAVFRVRLMPVPSVYVSTGFPGVVPLDVRGCSSALSGETNAGNFNGPRACHIAQATPQVDSFTSLNVALGLVSALPVPPAAALTVGRDLVQAPGTTLRLSNPDPNTATAVHAGGGITGAIQTFGPPGSTAGLQEQGDAAMYALSAAPDAFFQALFGMLPPDYQHQPAALRLACAGTCTSSGDLAPALAANPTRIIWVNGDLNFDLAANLGSAALPAMIVVTGSVTFSAPVTLTGVVYSAGPINWNGGAAGGTVVGALIGATDFNGQGDATVVYDREVVRRIRQFYGSFARVPGSWRIKLSA